MSAFGTKRTSARVFCCDAVHSSRPKIVLNFQEGGSPPGDYPMRRREFIRLFSSTVVVWPLTARAQQTAMPVVAFLSVGSPDAMAGRVNAFRKGLGETGYTEDRNVQVEYHWLEGQYEHLSVVLAPSRLCSAWRKIR